jgi:hypothetical protein
MSLVHAFCMYTHVMMFKVHYGIDIPPLILRDLCHQGLIGGVASLPERNCGSFVNLQALYSLIQDKDKTLHTCTC